VGSIPAPLQRTARRIAGDRRRRADWGPVPQTLRTSLQTKRRRRWSWATRTLRTSSHARGIHVDSTTHAVLCWGGDMFQMKSPVPERVPLPDEASIITTGQFHDCALTRARVAYCWGTNTDGELGDGTTRDSATPQRVSTDRRFAAISTGGNIFVGKPGEVSTWGFTCGVTVDGVVMCWGDNRHGTLGNGTIQRALTPTAIANP